MFWFDDAIKKLVLGIVHQLGSTSSLPEVVQEPTVPDSLHICPECKGAFVFPVQAFEIGMRQYDVTLHCANCDAERTGIYYAGELEQLDLAMDESMRAVIDFHDELHRFNKRDEVDRFVAAIHADQILPEDF